MIRVMIAVRYSEVREGLCMLLRLANGIAVTGAADGLEGAIRQASSDCPDVTLVDLEMPDGEGYALIRQLKRLNARIRVIALTAHDYPAARERAIQAGADRVLVKGVAVQAMVEAILQAAA